jgi:endonuclease III
VSAAQKTIEEYAGSAGNIWPDGSSVVQVVERLSAFDGIGRKKAVMTAEILSRHFGVRLAGRESGRVAYDVQVRRVFLRSGLADDDNVEAIEAAAVLACADAPGVLDLPAWLIGRETCRPRTPRCDECKIRDVCARRTWILPEGVGARRTRADSIQD